VFWRDSLNFQRIIKQQKDKISVRNSSLGAGSLDRNERIAKKAAENAVA
jgi:hypothetical protein